LNHFLPSRSRGPPFLPRLFYQLTLDMSPQINSPPLARTELSLFSTLQLHFFCHHSVFQTLFEPLNEPFLPPPFWDLRGIARSLPIRHRFVPWQLFSLALCFAGFFGIPLSAIVPFPEEARLLPPQHVAFSSPRRGFRRRYNFERELFLPF